MNLRVACYVAGCSLLPAGVVLAQGYPVKPVRLVVPYPAGGVNDIIARVLAQKLGENLGQQVVIDNRPGAGGNLGTDHVAKAAPDGYTLLSGGVGSLTMNPGLGKVPYDTLRDFAPIALVATAPKCLLFIHRCPRARSASSLRSPKRGRPKFITARAGSAARRIFPLLCSP